ncbi:hypothetical protein PVAP13_8KG272501 [Panicum virgatum]|uniref:CASP-like protein n=1 Tax=Panicum virgatum TaxID=38727 RepID=A0A8T0PUG3_PANVG|nr:hypothetical protein PVAP13_8KG272501 [Panicum virgatum]
MALSSRTLGVITLVLRAITLSLLAASLAILAAARVHRDAIYIGDVLLQPLHDFTFKDRYTYRYVFSIATIGCAYTLLLIPLSAIMAVQGRGIGGTSFVKFLIFADIVFCALFSTGGAAGLGFVVDYQLHDKGAPIRTRRFLYMVDASCGLLLGAAICTVVMIMISVYMK